MGQLCVLICLSGGKILIKAVFKEKVMGGLADETLEGLSSRDFPIKISHFLNFL